MRFQATLGIADKTGNLFLPGALLWTAETKVLLGSYDDALDALGRYEKLVERVGSVEGLAWFPSRGVAHRVYGVIAGRRGEPAKALAQFERSLALLAAHGYKPDLARTYVALGEFERDRGRAHEAREAFERATAAFREMGFTFELNRAPSQR